METGDWSSAENQATVEAYFAMLSLELDSIPFNKAAHRRRLMAHVQRPEKAIEFKHQNISAVLLGLGHPRIEGYKPASNFQLSLVDAVVRHLQQGGNWLPTYLPVPVRAQRVRDEQNLSTLRIEPAPTLRNELPSLDLKKISAVATKYEVAERDARNRELGFAGEELVFSNERLSLVSAGREDLARKIRWVSRDEGDGAGYDIASYDPEGTKRLIEVKTTNGWERTPFHITRNEVAVAESNRDTWLLMRLWNFARQARAFEIRPPLQRHLELTPTSFLAQIR